MSGMVSSVESDRHSGVKGAGMYGFMQGVHKPSEGTHGLIQGKHGCQHCPLRDKSRNHSPESKKPGKST
jgi:hypothetical protein